MVALNEYSGFSMFAWSKVNELQILKNGKSV